MSKTSLYEQYVPHEYKCAIKYRQNDMTGLPEYMIFFIAHHFHIHTYKRNQHHERGKIVLLMANVNSILCTNYLVRISHAHKHTQAHIWYLCTNTYKHTPINTHTHTHIDGLGQDCSNSIANTLELLQSCAKPTIWYVCVPYHLGLLHYHWGSAHANAPVPVKYMKKSDHYPTTTNTTKWNMYIVLCVFQTKVMKYMKQ